MYLKLSPVLNWSLKKKKERQMQYELPGRLCKLLTAFGKLMLQSTGGDGGFKP